jgi:hypothetical protein
LGESDQMVTIRTSGWKPTVQDVLARSGLTSADIDHEFGVVATYPAQHEYTVKVRASAVNRMRSSPGFEVVGSFSNPPIEPFGPVR